MSEIEWLLPTTESRRFNEEYVKANAKYHCFIDDREDEEKDSRYRYICKSLCGRHSKIMYFYEAIESGEIASRPEIACPICRKKWLKEFNVLC